MFPSNKVHQAFALSESSSQKQDAFRKEQEERLKQSGAMLILEAAQKGIHQDGRTLKVKERVFIEDVLSPMIKGHNGFHEGTNTSLIDFLAHDGKFANKFVKEYYSGFESIWLGDIKCFAATPSIFDLEKNAFSICHTGTKDRILAFLNVMKGQQGNVEETRKNLVIKRKDGTSFFPAGFLRVTAPLSVDGCNPEVINSLAQNINDSFRARLCNDEPSCSFTKEVCATLGIEPYKSKNIQEQFLSSVVQVVFTLDDPSDGELKEEMVIGFSVNTFKLPDFGGLISEISKAILEIKEVCKQNGKELAFVTLNLFDIFVPIDAIFKKQPSAVARSNREALEQLKRRLDSKSSSLRGAEASFVDGKADKLAPKFSNELKLDELHRLKKEISMGIMPKTIAASAKPAKLSESRVRAIIAEDIKRYESLITKEQEAILANMIEEFVSFLDKDGKFTEANIALIAKMDNEHLVDIVLVPLGTAFIEAKFEEFKKIVPQSSQLIEPSAKLFFGFSAACSPLKTFLSVKGLTEEQVEIESNKIFKLLFKQIEDKLVQEYMEKA